MPLERKNRMGVDGTHGLPQAIADKTGVRPHGGRFLRLPQTYTSNLKLAIIFQKIGGHLQCGFLLPDLSDKGLG
jgi:hypothetical protein